MKVYSNENVWEKIEHSVEHVEHSVEHSEDTEPVRTKQTQGIQSCPGQSKTKQISKAKYR